MKICVCTIYLALAAICLPLVGESNQGLKHEESKEGSKREEHHKNGSTLKESFDSDSSLPNNVKPEHGSDDMDWEGGRQEEEEQSESSLEDHSEGEESEQENDSKDINIDHEWIRKVTNDINQLQLDHNHIRDSIRQNCKNVADDATQQIQNSEKKMELDLREQVIYTKTLQTDIETWTKKFKREQTDFTLETRALNKRIDDIDKHQDYVITSIETLALLSTSLL